LQSILKSGLLNLDHNEAFNATKFAQPVIGYHNPRLLYYTQIYIPCRAIAKLCIEENELFLQKGPDILELLTKFKHALT
jgi:hypothetical protein